MPLDEAPFADIRAGTEDICASTICALDDEAAVITGASSGLGIAFSVALAKARANVASGGRRLARLCEVKDMIETSGGHAITVQPNVTDPAQCKAFGDDAFECFGRIDILANSAGLGSVIPDIRESPDNFRRAIDTILMGSYLMEKSCAKHMSEGSSIINVSTVLAMTIAGLP